MAIIRINRKKLCVESSVSVAVPQSRVLVVFLDIGQPAFRTSKQR